MTKPHSCRECYFYDNNEVYFFDHTHPSYKGGEIISEMIVKEILKIKKN